MLSIFLSRLWLFKPVFTQAKVTFIYLWKCWHGTSKDRQVLSFSLTRGMVRCYLQSYTFGRSTLPRAIIKRAGIKPLAWLATALTSTAALQQLIQPSELGKNNINSKRPKSYEALKFSGDKKNLESLKKFFFEKFSASPSNFYSGVFLILARRNWIWC